MNPKRTDAWRAAEWEYSGIHAERMMPFFDRSASPDEMTEQLAEKEKEAIREKLFNGDHVRPHL